jgi:hypothetical protein
MSNENRGSIKYPDRYKQLISYKGLEIHRNISPTDIDGVIDYNGNAFIFLECKLYEKEIDWGQKLAIENLINGLSESGRPSCCLVFRHNKNPDEMIIAKDCIVSEIYFQGKWYAYNNNVLNCIRAMEYRFRKMNISL